MAKGGRGGKFRPNEAGIQHRLDEKDWGTKREFVGSGTREYIFVRPDGGFLIIRANTYEEASAQAKTRGAKRYRRKGR